MENRRKNRWNIICQAVFHLFPWKVYVFLPKYFNVCCVFHCCQCIKFTEFLVFYFCTLFLILYGIVCTYQSISHCTKIVYRVVFLSFYSFCLKMNIKCYCNSIFQVETKFNLEFFFCSAALKKHYYLSDVHANVNVNHCAVCTKRKESRKKITLKHPTVIFLLKELKLLFPNIKQKM